MKPNLPTLLVSGTALLSLNSIVAKEQQQPNILFVCIDDLRTQIGAYGNKSTITPNLDKIAAEGRLFNNQYVQVPTSGPSRACMLTGQPMKRIEDINHHFLAKKLAGTEEGVEPETFVHHLRRNGYYTVGMGKVSHNSRGHVRREGKLEMELPHSWDKFIFDEQSIWKGVDPLHSYADGVGRQKDRTKNPSFQFLDVSDERYPDGRLAEVALGELDELAQNKGDKPFFMAVGFYKPHLPFCAPKKYWDMYSDEDIEPSPNPLLPEGVSSLFLHNSDEFNGQYNHPEGEKAGMGKQLSAEYARDLRHAYCAALTYSDAQLGKLMAKLKETGLDKNTIIIVWGDHGWHLGEHTIWGKHSSFERALNSTFMVKMPKQKKAGVATDGLIAAIDIYPTVCDLAGVEKPNCIEGESFVKLIDNPKAKGKDDVISYWRNILSIRTDRYRMALFNNGTTEEVMLFDHKLDPNETRNVAAENPAVVADLRARIKAQNNGFLPALK
ncbi:MAG: sulfatase [Rikenellaceae bacterium]